MAEETGDLKDTIRNLGQTHQERPIIKMAPDSIIYIDGLPYLLNDFVGKSGTLFNFNDFVTQASGAADLNTWVPTCTVNLSLPNDLRYLAQAPSGQRIIKTMSEIKIFTKGYYLTDNGDSVYHRVFWGVVASVTYSDNKRTMEITLTCKGILHLFELMQINVAPSVVTAQHTGGDVTPMIDKWANLNPFEIILHAFKYPLREDVTDQETLAENNAWLPKDMFERVYASKWNRHLLDMRKAVRLHGLRVQDGPKNGSAAITQAPTTTKPDPDAKTPSESTASRQGMTTQTKDEVQRELGIDHNLIAKFLPTFKIGTINLLQSTVTSRLTRIDEMVRTMGWEGYQDLDGSIVIKPPLYNLDTQNTKAAPERNPFIIHLPEVLTTETETEDEGQIRATRLSVQGSLDKTPMLSDGPSNILNTATFLDPALVRQFGIRSEPVKTMPVIADNSYALFAFAASEMTKLNKNYRTYTVSIPMRPELRLGFPLYIPHLDIYAYLENISWSYVRGGQATMTLSCTNLRHRELFAKEKVTKQGELEIKEWIYNSVPDLVLAYTAAPAQDQSKNSKNQLTTPVGSAGTQPPKDPKSHDPSTDQKELLAREERLRKLTGTEPDAKGISWRVSEDASGFFKNAAKGGVVDRAYYDQITHGTMPYTDAKGYTVQRPFPWGRYLTLEETLDLLTRPEARRTKKLLPFEAPDAKDTQSSKPKDPDTKLTPTQGLQIKGSDNTPDAFIMSGLGTPSLSTTDPTKGTPADKQMFDKLVALKEKIDDDTICFILSFSVEDGNQTDPNTFNSAEAGGNNAAPKDGGTPAPPADAGKDKAEALVYDVAKGKIVGETELSQ